MRLYAILVALAAVAASILSASAPASERASVAAAPIEGYWTYGSPASGSLIVVRPSASGFEGVKLVGFGASACTTPNPTAFVFFRVAGSGMRYTGGHFWVRNPPQCDGQAFSTDSVLELASLDRGQICSSSPWVSTYRECLGLVRGCSAGVGAASGAPVCVGSASKAAARVSSARWATAAAVAERLTRSLRGADRRNLRALGLALGRYERAQAKVFGIIAKDPPDAAYRVVARPAQRATPRAGSPARRALLASLSRANGIGQALVTTIDRAAGARLANDVQALTAQNAAALCYAQRLGTLIPRQPALARTVARSEKPTSQTGRRLLAQLRAPAFTARAGAGARILRAFVDRNR